MTVPPRTDGDSSLRANLRKALALLKEAGWEVRDGRLRNAKGEPFTVEFLDNSGAMGRVITPYTKNLEKLGFQVNYKVKKTSASKIQEAIAAAGYDTQDFTAPNDVYSKLHGCCQYERKAVSKL
jgi:ABC-type transport system substrate-binding protein